MVEHDVITDLTADHREVEALFQRLDGSADPAEQAGLLREVIRALVRHSEAEEQVVYPQIARALGDKAPTEQAIHEHSVVEVLLKELDGMPATDVRFADLLRQVMAEVRHHVAEEEGQLFPAWRELADPALLRDLSEAVATAKKASPTHPHPAAPDHPPLNAVAGVPAALLDRAKDTLHRS